MIPKKIRGPIGVAIAGLGKYLPERIVTNEEWANQVDTSDQWITEKLGIKTRRFCSPDQASSDLAVEAARAALQNAHLSPEDVDLIIMTSINPDHKDPAPASLVQHRLGAKNAAAFNLSVGGCPDSIFSLVTAAQFILSGSYKTVLVVNAEVLTRGLIDQKDRRTCVIFGDGAGATVLRATKPGVGILGYILCNDGSQYDAILAEAGGSRMPLDEEGLRKGLHYVKLDGKRVFEFGSRVFPASIRQVVTDSGYQLEQLKLLICHQANLNMIKAGMAQLDLPLSKTFINIDRYGNTAGASIPIALTEAVEEGLVSAGDLITLSAFGAGLAWATALVRWPSREDFL